MINPIKRGAPVQDIDENELEVHEPKTAAAGIIPQRARAADAGRMRS